MSLTITKCRFGSKCYEIKDPKHLAVYSHDMVESKTESKPRMCNKGFECTNLDAKHLHRFNHPTMRCDQGLLCPNTNERHRIRYTHEAPPCKDGKTCKKLNVNAADHQDHIHKYAHPTDVCPNGTQCGLLMWHICTNLTIAGFMRIAEADDHVAEFHSGPTARYIVCPKECMEGCVTTPDIDADHCSMYIHPRRFGVAKRAN